MNHPRTIEWIGGVNGHIRLIDQTLLPTRLEYRDCRTVEEIWEAIRVLRVRGAPAIGVAAAMGVVLGMQKHMDAATYEEKLKEVGNYLRTSRPTAVNLFWAIERMERHVLGAVGDKGDATLQTGVASPLSPNALSSKSTDGRPWTSPEQLNHLLLQEALAIEEEDRRLCAAIGEAGAELIGDNQGVLTHCNAGGLATAGMGTALAPMFRAAQRGIRFHVFVDETRPLLQGARLTAWELQQQGIPLTLICDNMAAVVMRERRAHLAIVGADRIAANGDTANKIGTYGLAVLARAHGIPFYVAAPSSTFDLSIPSGDAIPIEQRDPAEITCGFGRRTAPEGVPVYNPAFDVTPAELIAGIITEKGLIRPVGAGTIRATLGEREA